MSYDITRRKTLSVLGTAAGGTLLTNTVAAQEDGNQDAPSLTRFAYVPLGAEVTGLRVSPQGALFMNVQHPSEENPAPYNRDVIGAIVGINEIPEDVQNLPAPKTEAEKRTVKTAVGHHQVLAHGAQSIGDGNLLGVPNDTNGKPMSDEAEADMNVFVPTGDNEGYLFTNFEARPGMISRMFLSRSSDTAEWNVDSESIENLDVRSMEGTWNNCNGWLSPWGTPLSSEEYEPRGADWFGADGTPSGAAKTFEEYLGYFGNAYRYGYIVEVENPTGKAKPTKRFALGRFSHEVALPMSDLRTVYLSDDYSGGTLFKFVADKPADLSSGTLYASKLTQDETSDYNKAGFSVEWVELAHATESEIESWIAEYDGQDPSSANYEPNYITDTDVQKWSKGNADDDRVAFLEPRKAAAAKGATVEWQKLEGLSIRPGAKPGDVMYIACSNIRRTMSDKKGDIQLDTNHYGAVYGAQLTGAYNVKKIDPVLTGGPNANVVAGDNAADGDADPVNTLWGPDNIEKLSDGRGLFGEDSDRENNMLWLFDPKKGIQSRYNGKGK